MAWALGGAVLAAITGGLYALATNHSILGSIAGAVGWASPWAFLTGSAFATTLTLVERRGSLNELSARRFTIMGSLVGTALPIVFILANGPPFGPIAAVLGISGIFGAASGAMAAGTIAIAKRRDPQIESAGEREALTPGE